MNYRLKSLRKRRGLSQAEVARAVFVAQNTYSYYENGKRDIPTATLVRLAELYGVSVDYILCRTDEPRLNI